MDLAALQGVAVRSRQELLEGETPSIYQIAAERNHGVTTGLTAVKKADGTILTEPDEVREEVFQYFDTLFHGRHETTPTCPEPFDSGRPFCGNPRDEELLLEDLPTLDPQQAAELETPFTIEELEVAVLAASNNKSPGLDGLPYEFYKKTFASTGPVLLSALNAMLEAGELSSSLRRGVVRLIPKVTGVPMASQLRPITLLSTDYKLLTKMMVARMALVTASVLTATQMCSVEGRSIFDGAAAILSAADHLHQNQLPGYLVSLDFFHAYDRVSVPWVLKVLEAMGFGPNIRHWIEVLLAGATATFMLHDLTPDLEVKFSIRQGDPFAVALYTFNVEPLLVILQKILMGLLIGKAKEKSFGFMDDIAGLGNKEEDLPLLDDAVQAFERASGAILNRNRKSVILGLGTWAGRTDWPLPWIQSVTSAKLYGIDISADPKATINLTWERVTAKVEATINMWKPRILPTLLLRRQALEIFALSKVWYFAQILPLPEKYTTRLKAAAGALLWKGRLERLKWDELLNPASQGGIGLVDIQSRAQALLAKQACHRLAGGGNPALHLQYWIGLTLRRELPDLAVGPHAEIPTKRMKIVAGLIREVLSSDDYCPETLGVVTSKALYVDFTSTPPPPKIEEKLPHLPWRKIWNRLLWVGPTTLLWDMGFSLLNNILPLRHRLHRMGKIPDPDCDICGAPLQDAIHFFTHCSRTSNAWSFLIRAVLLQTGTLCTSSLLFLDTPPLTVETSCWEKPIVIAVLTFVEWAWETRDEARILSTPVLVERVRRRTPPGVRSIFKL